jgi:hypothetical protein
VSDANGKVAVSTVTSTELGYLDGVTSAIQTQLDGKVDDTQFAGTSQSLTTDGFQKLPGGLIIQWGRSGSIGHDTYTTLNFPQTFPNAVLAAYSSITNSVDDNDDVFSRVMSTTTSQISIRSEGTSGGDENGTRNLQYLAIGY